MAFFIETFTTEIHGGGSWDFPNCVWAPTLRTDGISSGYWKTILEVKKGDIIFHLKGKHPNAKFVGFSVAKSDGYETEIRPPNPENWSYAEIFFRADLEQYIPFPKEVRLSNVFATQESNLRYFYAKNSVKNRSTKLKLFYTIQNEELRKTNGGYFTHADQELISILFDNDLSFTGHSKKKNQKIKKRIENTQNLIVQAMRRVGQRAFAENVKINFGYQCCFPGCEIADEKFLVGAHIARWADHEELRGDIKNGLCLCLLHDKAFEVGYFMLDDNLRVKPHPEIYTKPVSPVRNQIISKDGVKISKSKEFPSNTAVQLHRNRVLGKLPCRETNQRDEI